MQTTITLPTPSAEELAHSARLCAAIRAQIAAHGALDFSRYMAMALYEPGLGYYSAGRTKFGAAGDFVTAPELGDVFARCVARALAPALGDGRCMLELGAGSGAFAADALCELERIGALPDMYWILETSADLRERQAALLAARVPRMASRIQWLDAPPESGWRGALFANEVVDALPVRAFAWRDDGLRERCVDVDAEGRLSWCERAADPPLQAAFARAVESPDTLSRPYRSELVPDLDAWFAAIACSLQSGIALFVDYGYSRGEYYLPQRSDGTLVCHYRHRAHADPLWLPGLSDITAFVDFTALAEAGWRAGFQPVCYASQAQFLLATGLPEFAGPDPAAPALDQLRLAQQLRRLTLPGEMGERFKVLAFCRDFDPFLAPWVRIDQGQRL